jgi:hypothetical protein
VGQLGAITVVTGRVSSNTYRMPEIAICGNGTPEASVTNLGGLERLRTPEKPMPPRAGNPKGAIG